MMRSLFSGVSGLKNHQTRMDVVGNNISNVNTTGFKSSRATFTDMLSQTLNGASAPTGTIGGTNPKQIGLGSSVSSIDLLFTNGSVQSTGKNTDLALSGSGLFVVSDGRTEESAGLSLYELSEFLQELGCKTAYNLDGGGSSTMVFQGEGVNKPTTGGDRISERAVSDIVYIKKS